MEKKILIVDDSALMRKMIKDILLISGFSNVIEAEDGETACDMYETEKPGLVFMDIIMENKSGLEALSQIKEFDPQAKIVICSAMRQEKIVREATTLGAIDFIVKPFKFEDVKAIIEKAFNNL